MAVFQRLSEVQIKRDFTHVGLMFGLVPVYIGDPEGECRVCVRNWWPEWLLDVAEVLMNSAITVKCWLDPYYEPMYPMKITGKIEK